MGRPRGGVCARETKRFVHLEESQLDRTCQTLLDPDQSHRLMVYTVESGSESHEELRLLGVVSPAGR